MTTANDTVELIPVENTYERRGQPRVNTDAKVKLITKDAAGKRLTVDFNIKNISRSGFCLHMNDWPDFKAPPSLNNPKFHHMVIMLSLNEKTTRIYHVKAYLRHRTANHGIGFFFIRMKE